MNVLPFTPEQEKRIIELFTQLLDEISERAQSAIKNPEPELDQLMQSNQPDKQVNAYS